MPLSLTTYSMATILNPPGDKLPVSVSQPVLFVADRTATWSDGGAGGSFSSASGLTTVYTPPSSVTSADASGNKGLDSIIVTATSHAGSDTRTLALVQGIPKLNPTLAYSDPTSRPTIPTTVPSYIPQPGGPSDPSNPAAAAVADPENLEDEHECSRVDVRNPFTDHVAGGESCQCGPGGGNDTATSAAGGGGSTNVASVGAGAAGLVQPEPMLGVLEEVARLPCKISATKYGEIQAKSGCQMLPTRGVWLDLGVYISNVADGLLTTEQFAGIRASFGWQIRLIKDTNDNAAIYWGNRCIEGWPTDGAGGYDSSRGTFGTLSESTGFTRTTKDGRIYSFDSDGRIEHIRDRSSDGNAAYFEYNGSNQVIRIEGPGMGYEPYFKYNGSGFVESMTLESGVASEARTTYYEYDGTNFMTTMIGPENCITYFDVDANFNLTQIKDPDNYTTNLEYTSDTIPRIKNLQMPEGSEVYFTYDDSVPRSTKTQVGNTGGSLYFDYQWAGLPEKTTTEGETETVTAEYEDNAKPTQITGTDDNTAYFEWDSSGQAISQKLAGISPAIYFEYGSEGRIASYKDRNGNVTYWNYDADNQETEWTDPLSKTTYFERDSFGKIQSRKDRNGNVTYYEYDTQGSKQSVKWADDSVRYFEYTSAGELISVKDELANVAYYDRDDLGRITKWKDFLGNATEFGFDNRSNRTLKIDRRGNAWYWEYDGLSRDLASRTAELNTTYFDYNTENTLKSTKDPRGNLSYLYYETRKRLQAQENALQERTYFEYMSAGQVVSIKDARGNSNYLDYDSFHRQIAATNGTGDTTYFEFDSAGNRTLVTDPRGNPTNSFYGENNRLTAVADPFDNKTYFYYDDNGNQNATEDALKHLTYFYFDKRNRQFATEDALKNTTYFQFDDRNLQIAVKDARGNPSYMEYDADGRQVSNKDALGNTAYLEYDANGNQLASKDQRGNTTYFEYTADNEQQSIKDPLNNLSYLEYDTAGNRTSSKDARGNVSYFYFDAVNREFASEDARQATTYFEFDALGNQITVTDPLGRSTYFQFDAANRNNLAKDALSGVTYIEYDSAGNRKNQKNARGFTSYFEYDGLNRVISSQLPEGGTTYFTYDAGGNSKSVKDPVGRLNYLYYDLVDRLEATENGLQARIYFEFDAVGNQVAIKDPLGNARYFTYDSLNREESRMNELGDVWYFEYDPASNVANDKNPRQALTYWEYDERNFKLSRKDPLGRTWYWEYNPVGSIDVLKDPMVRLTYHEYDAVNQLEKTHFSSSDVWQYFEYDLVRNQTAMKDETGRTEWQYGNLNRPIKRANPLGRTLYYEFDAVGNRTKLTDPDGFVIQYAYDGDDRMTGATSAGYGLQPYGLSPYGGFVSTYDYNAAGQNIQELRANGTFTYFNFDDAARLSDITHDKSDATLLQRLAYAHDANDNITLITRTAAASQLTYFEYDSASQLTREHWTNPVTGATIYGFEYTYDQTGNRLFRSNSVLSETRYWEYDEADQNTVQMDTDGTTVKVYFTYDSDGNVQIEDDVDAGEAYYEYDQRNLLTRIDFPAGGPVDNSFEYNAMSERVAKVDSTGSTYYTWDGLVPLLEKNASGGTVQRMIKGYSPIAGIGEYSIQDFAGEAITPHKNHVGSTILMTNDSENVENTYILDAWGVPLDVTQGVSQQYRFTGKESGIDSLQASVNNARIHFPSRTLIGMRGQFLQHDPILLNSASVSPPYSYVRQLPTALVDPLGLQDERSDPLRKWKLTSTGPGAAVSIGSGFGVHWFCKEIRADKAVGDECCTFTFCCLGASVGVQFKFGIRAKTKDPIPDPKLGGLGGSFNLGSIEVIGGPKNCSGFQDGIRVFGGGGASLPFGAVRYEMTGGPHQDSTSSGWTGFLGWTGFTGIGFDVGLRYCWVSNKKACPKPKALAQEAQECCCVNFCARDIGDSIRYSFVDQETRIFSTSVSCKSGCQTFGFTTGVPFACGPDSFGDAVRDFHRSSGHTGSPVTRPGVR